MVGIASNVGRACDRADVWHWPYTRPKRTTRTIWCAEHPRADADTGTRHSQRRNAAANVR